MKVIFVLFSISLTLPLIVCRKFKVRRLASIEDQGALQGGKLISVFGVKVIAQPTVCNKNLQYAANILAQSLDGNEDGLPDDKRVIKQLEKHRSALLIFNAKVNKDDLKKFPYRYIILETDKCKKKRNWKNTVIAVFRLIAAYGLSPAYPRALGAKEPSTLRENLNVLIGNCGYVNEKTLRWPDCKGHAFYNDSSCGKECMAKEYLAQLMTMSLGVLPSISDYEGVTPWRFKSKNAFFKKDMGRFRSMKLILQKMILQKLSAKVPNGNYRPGRKGYRMACSPSRQCSVMRIRGKVIEVAL